MPSPARRLLSALPLAVTVFAQYAFAQASHAPTQSPTPLVTRSDLVLVPVIVTDKSNQPVLHLPQSAFHLEESGQSRAISFFEENSDSANTSLTLHPIPVTPGTTYNFLPASDRSPRITVFVLDLLNTPSLRQSEAKKQLVDYLLRVSNHNQPIAIFGLNSRGLHLFHAFTTDTRVLVDALQKLQISLNSEESTQPPSTLTEDPYLDPQATQEELLMSQFLQELDDSVSAAYQRIAARQTLSALTQLARAFSSVPGRKTLIWATAGFPFIIDDPQSFARQGDDLRPQYEDVWRALNSANVAVYPVDLGTVDFTAKNLPSANSGTSNSQIAAMRGANGAGGPRSPLKLPYDQGVQQRLTLHAFANATGGRACVTVSEFEKCFAEAVDDSRSYYLLGYYLAGDTQPGWRKLKVKVDGDGLHVRYRAGFYVAPKLPDTPEQRRSEIVNALASEVPYTALRLSARIVSPSPPDAPPAASRNAPARTAEFMLGVMGDTLTIARENQNAIDLQITVLAFDANRKSVASFSQSISTHLQPDRLDKIQSTGLGIPEKLELPPGRYEIKFAVRDNLSSALGTVSLPLNLP